MTLQQPWCNLNPAQVTSLSVSPIDEVTKPLSEIVGHIFLFIHKQYAPEVSDTILQVVAAVGFKGRRLEIPKDLNPLVAALIESCWAKYAFLFHSYTPFIFTSLNLITRTWAYCTNAMSFVASHGEDPHLQILWKL
jgi:hypothetical protein